MPCVSRLVITVLRRKAHGKDFEMGSVLRIGYPTIPVGSCRRRNQSASRKVLDRNE